MLSTGKCWNGSPRFIGARRQAEPTSASDCHPDPWARRQGGRCKQLIAQVPGSTKWGSLPAEEGLRQGPQRGFRIRVLHRDWILFSRGFL